MPNKKTDFFDLFITILMIITLVLRIIIDIMLIGVRFLVGIGHFFASILAMLLLFGGIFGFFVSKYNNTNFPIIFLLQIFLIFGLVTIFPTFFETTLQLILNFLTEWPLYLRKWRNKYKERKKEKLDYDDRNEEDF